MEYEGTQIDTGNYKLKKLGLALASREAEIKALKALLEENKRVSDENIETLKRSVKFYQSRVKITRKPREKPVVETKDNSQRVQETAGEDPASPPISQEE